MYKLASTLAHPGQGKATVGQLAGTVFWAFFGVRKGKDSLNDAAKISPRQLVIAGLVGVIILHAAMFAVAHVIAGSEQYDVHEINELRELASTVAPPSGSQ